MVVLKCVVEAEEHRPKTLVDLDDVRVFLDVFPIIPGVGGLKSCRVLRMAQVPPCSGLKPLDIALQLAPPSLESKLIIRQCMLGQSSLQGSRR